MELERTELHYETEHKEIGLRALILSGLFLCSISEGYIFGQMSGMIASMETDEDLSLTNDEISWIASTINVTSVCGFAIASVVSELLGRRRAISVLSAPIIANWVLLYYAVDYATFLLSRLIVGVCFGGVLVLVFVCTSEYTAPKARGFYLNLMTTVGTTTGTAIGHILSTILHWRTVALLGLIPTIISCLLPWFWVESPFWLATKGKFEECRKSYRALHGHRGKEAENELQQLIELEKFKMNKISTKPESMLHIFKTVKKAVSQRYFWKLTLYMAFISSYRVAAGKIQYSILGINMVQDVTGSSDVLMYTIIVDLFFVTGSILSCFLIRIMKMRSLLFFTAAVANAILLILSACIYFRPAESELFPWINSALLAIYFILMTSGPYPIMDAMLVELVPLEIRSFGIFTFAVFAGFAFMLGVKLIGPMYIAMGYHGIFLLNIGLMSICLVFCWFKLPETKGKTLQEIELFIKTGTYENKQQLLDRDQITIFQPTLI